jgi:hypothetical protein
MLLSQKHQAVECGVSYLRTTLAKPSWCLQEVEPAMKVLSCAPAWLLPKPARDELLAYLCYLGGLKAVFEGYYPVVSFLMEQVTLPPSHLAAPASSLHPRDLFLLPRVQRRRSINIHRLLVRARLHLLLTHDSLPPSPCMPPNAASLTYHWPS